MSLSPVMRRILAALEEHGDMDTEELAEATCASVGTLRDGGYMRHLLGLELVRVSRWVRSSAGPAAPVYSITPGKSAVKPKPYTTAEKNRRWKRKVGYRNQQWRQSKALKELARISA